MHFNGLLRPDSGQLVYEGKPFSYDRKSLLRLRQRVGIVFQDPDTQLFSASVEQEVAFGPLNLGWPKEEVKKRVAAVMEATGLEQLKSNPTHLLSYGQKKRVAIAAVLAMQPEVVVFDEPTAWLDPLGCRQVLALLEDLHVRGKTVVLSTHDVDLAFSWADHVLVMSSGRKLAMGNTVDVMSDYELLEKAGLAVPWVLEVHREMAAEGLIAGQGEIPRDRHQLLQLFRAYSRLPGIGREVRA